MMFIDGFTSGFFFGIVVTISVLTLIAVKLDKREKK